MSRREIMEFIVTDRASIEREIIVRTAYVVISIHDANKPPARIPRRVGMRDKLYVCFDDSVPEPGSERQHMTADDATAIWNFVQRHREDVGTIVCHCEQGMSRSPAVAAALATLLCQDNRHFFEEYQPNEYVYELMLRAGEFA